MRLYAFFVLYVLHQRDGLSGYEIAKTINEITEGYFSPTPGNIYPVLTSLAGLGFIEPKKSEAAGKGPVSRRKKTPFEITAAGGVALLDFAKRDKERFEKLTFFFDKVIEDAS